MDPGSGSYSSTRGAVPRTRGDEPVPQLLMETARTGSPHARGWRGWPANRAAGQPFAETRFSRRDRAAPGEGGLQVESSLYA